jgi:hypothetical protein
MDCDAHWYLLTQVLIQTIACLFHAFFNDLHSTLGIWLDSRHMDFECIECSTCVHQVDWLGGWIQTVGMLITLKPPGAQVTSSSSLLFLVTEKKNLTEQTSLLKMDESLTMKDVDINIILDFHPKNAQYHNHRLTLSHCLTLWNSPTVCPTLLAVSASATFSSTMMSPPLLSSECILPLLHGLAASRA